MSTLFIINEYKDRHFCIFATKLVNDNLLLKPEYERDQTEFPPCMAPCSPSQNLDGSYHPVMIGTSLAFADGQFKIVPALLCMLFACGMQIAANFINDLFDFLKGTDRTDRLGPERACAQGWIHREP